MGPKTERLTILRGATHETELGDHDFRLSRLHYTDTDPTSRERAATAGIEPGTSSPGAVRFTDWATAPPPPSMQYFQKYGLTKLDFIYYKLSLKLEKQNSDSTHESSDLSPIVCFQNQQSGLWLQNLNKYQINHQSFIHFIRIFQELP